MMFLRRSVLLVVALAPLLHASAAEQRLYDIEVVVFARSGAGEDGTVPVPHYPAAARRLATTGSTPAVAHSAAATGTGESSATDGSPAPPPPIFESLERGRRLTDVARRIERQSDLRLLVHERWVQPAERDGRPAPVALSGGRRFGDHRELEGYLTLEVGRFLHLAPNLWLTRFVGNDEALPAAAEPDVPLTLPPQPPRYQPPASVSTRSLLDAERDASGTNAAEATEALLRAQQSARRPADSQEPVPGEANSAATAPSYRVADLVALQQQRRLRFGELHYFDHPELGVIVQVSPIDPTPPADDAATAETPSVD